MTDLEIRELFSAATTIDDLLLLLNRIKKDKLGDKAFPFAKAQLYYFCNSSNTAEHYHIFEIPKKGKGTRKICQPIGMLKSMLRCVNTLLQAIYTPSTCATGFIPGRSVVDNARKHTDKLYVFNSDLKDFFPSISKTMVWKALRAKPISAPYNMTYYLSNLCCAKMVFVDSQIANSYEGSRFYDFLDEDPFDEQPRKIIQHKEILPQGSPASPTMSNIVCRNMDWQLENLARKYGCDYSRYADDMTFSSNRSIFSKTGDFYHEFEEIVRNNGFSLNESKTRLQKKGCRQEVTGLTVGKKVNVHKAFVRDLINVLHIWEKYGYDHAVAKYHFFHKNSQWCSLYKTDTCINLESIIRGKLNYLKMVKGENDSVYLRLKSKFVSLSGKHQIPTSRIDSHLSYSYPTTLRIPQFEKVMNCHISFLYEAYVYRNIEWFSGYMKINGRRAKAYVGKNTLKRLRERHENVNVGLLSSIRNKLYISLCYRYENRMEFWLITDCKPHSNTKTSHRTNYKTDNI